MEATIIRIQPGKKIASHFFSHKGEELGYLLAGRLEMIDENQPYEINPGDTVYLQKNTPGHWQNTADGIAEILWFKLKR